MTSITGPALIPLLLLALTGCEHGFADPSREYGPPVHGERHAVTIHQPSTLGMVDTSLRDVHGAPIGVSCDTCHGPTPELSWAARPGEPETFHVTVELQHGGLSCDACHDDDRTKLHLADRTVLAFGETMTLCAQCHGPQHRDYRRGSHGGMTGYWDLRQGPRTRNHCVDCHAPHAPAHGQVRPVHPPRDRFLDAAGSH